MPRLIDCLDLVEQKKNLCAPNLFLCWDGETHAMLNYRGENIWDEPISFTIEEIIQKAHEHEPWRTKQIVDYHSWLERYPEDADDIEGPFDDKDIFEVEWEEGN